MRWSASLTVTTADYCRALQDCPGVGAELFTIAEPFPRPGHVPDLTPLGQITLVVVRTAG